MRIFGKGDIMSSGKEYALSPYEISIINAALSKDKNVELIPSKSGVVIKSIKRETLN